MKSVKKNADLARSLMRRLNQVKNCCPHHASGGNGFICSSRSSSGSSGTTEYAYEMINSTLRFGRGVTAEVGYDVKNFGSKRPLIVTDANIAKTRAFK